VKLNKAMMKINSETQKTGEKMQKTAQNTMLKIQKRRSKHNLVQLNPGVAKKLTICLNLIIIRLQQREEGGCFENMKKIKKAFIRIFAIQCIILQLISAFSVTAVPNGSSVTRTIIEKFGFEEGSVSSWEWALTPNRNESPICKVSADTTEKFSGQKSAKIEFESSGSNDQWTVRKKAGTANEKISVQEGETYEFSIRAKVDTESTNGRIFIAFRLYEAGNDSTPVEWTYKWEPVMPDTNGGWQLLSRTITIGEEDMPEGIAKIQPVIVGKDSNMTVWIDDITISKVQVTEPGDSTGYVWDNVAIGGGGYVTGMVMHPTEPGLMYVRTDVGGAYRWDNDNNKWIPITDCFGDNETDFYSIDGIAIDPSNPDVVYIAVGYSPDRIGDVLKSEDRGNTWRRTNLNKGFWANGEFRITGECIMVDPNNSNIIYCGTRNEGLWKSTDGALTWQKVQSIPNDPDKYGVRSIAFGSGQAVNGATQTVYVGVKFKGVYVSNDGGQTFSLMSGGPDDCNMIKVASDNTLYVSSTNGLYKYKNGNWSNISPDNIGGFSGLSIDVNNSDVILCAGEYFSKPLPSGRTNVRNSNEIPIYYSSDGGQSWTNTIANAQKHVDITWIANTEFSAATAAVLLDPSDPKKAWFTDWFGVWMTPDITATPVQWYTKHHGIDEMVVFQVISTPSGANLLTGLADNDGMRHTDLTSYNQKKYGTPPLQETTGIDFCESDPNFIARVGSTGWGQKGGGGYSLNNGRTWTTFPGWPANAIGYRCAVSAENRNNIVVVPINNDVMYTTDRGYSFKKAKGAPSGLIFGFWSTNEPLASDRVDGKKFYICADQGFYTSSDGGATWQLTNNTLPYSGAAKVVKAAPGIKWEVWVGYKNGGLYRSSDAGKTFTPIMKLTSLINFAFGKPAPGSNCPTVFVYASIDGERGVFRSDDMGNSWVRINTDANKMGLTKYMAGDRQVYGRVYLATSGRGIYYGEPSN